MSRPTQAKYCPRCHAMNFVDAGTCLHCGHEFRTGVSSPPRSEDVFNKTQMFMMPPLAQHPSAEEAAPQVGGRWTDLVSRLASIHSSPLLPAIVLLVIVIAALIYGAIHLLR